MLLNSNVVAGLSSIVFSLVHLSAAAPNASNNYKNLAHPIRNALPQAGDEITPTSIASTPGASAKPINNSSSSLKSPLVPDIPFPRVTVTSTKTDQTTATTTATAWITQTTTQHTNVTSTEIVTKTKTATAIATETSVVTTTATDVSYTTKTETETETVTGAAGAGILTTTSIPVAVHDSETYTVFLTAPTTISVTEHVSETYTVFSTVPINVTSTLFETAPISQLANISTVVQPLWANSTATTPPTTAASTSAWWNGTAGITPARDTAISACTTAVPLVPCAGNTSDIVLSTMRTTRTVNVTRIAMSTSTILETRTVNATAAGVVTVASSVGGSGCVPVISDSPLSTSIGRVPKPSTAPSRSPPAEVTIQSQSAPVLETLEDYIGPAEEVP